MGEVKLSFSLSGALGGTREVLLFGFCLLLFGFLLLPSCSWGVGLTMSPLSFDLELLPGSKEELVCTLFNESAQEIRLQAFVAGTVEERDGTYRPAGPEDTLDPQHSCVAWVRLEEATLVLPPFGGKEIRAILTVPPSAQPGLYTAMIVFQAAAEEEKTALQGQAAVLKTKVDVLLGNVLFVRVRRRGVAQRWSGKFGVIEAFEVKGTEEGLRFSATFANRGRDIIEGKGKLIVTNALGKRVIESPLGSGRGRVLPGFSLDFVTLYTGNLPPGDYAALAVIDYGGVHRAEAKTIFHVEGKEVAERKREIQDVGIAAVNPVFLSVSKEILEGKISPGANRSFTVALYNDSSHTVVARGIAVDPAETESTHFSSFVEVAPEKVEIAPYKTKTVRITVKSPDSVSEGDKYVRVDFLPESVDGKPVPEELRRAFGASTLLVLENVKGVKILKADLTGIEFVLEGPPQKAAFRPRAVVRFRNTGSTHLQPSCTITLVRVQEETPEEGAVAVKPGSSLTLVSKKNPDLVLPGGEGMLVLESQNTLEPGKYTLMLVIAHQGKEILRKEETLKLHPGG
uniref:Uncharacterized protein n=1 Tax=Candidatus Caldatribacterium californiense TaxID=1454726 RepID=A0A7V3YK02_9BACT